MLSEYLHQEIATDSSDRLLLIAALHASERGQFTDALDLFSRAANASKKNSITFTTYIFAALAAQEISLTENLAAEYLDVIGESSVVYAYLAAAQQLSKDFDLARANLERAIALDVSDAKLYRQRVALEIECEEYESAKQVLDRAFDNVESEKSAALLAYAGYLSARECEWEAAMLSYVAACSLEANVDEYWYNLAICFKKLGRDEEAELALDKVKNANV